MCVGFLGAIRFYRAKRVGFKLEDTVNSGIRIKFSRLQLRL
jgi:hypothetical protein